MWFHLARLPSCATASVQGPRCSDPVLPPCGPLFFLTQVTSALQLSSFSTLFSNSANPGLGVGGQGGRGHPTTFSGQSSTLNTPFLLPLCNPLQVNPNPTGGADLVFLGGEGVLPGLPWGHSVLGAGWVQGAVSARRRCTCSLNYTQVPCGQVASLPVRTPFCPCPSLRWGGTRGAHRRLAPYPSHCQSG